MSEGLVAQISIQDKDTEEQRKLPFPPGDFSLVKSRLESLQTDNETLSQKLRETEQNIRKFCHRLEQHSEDPEVRTVITQLRDSTRSPNDESEIFTGESVHLQLKLDFEQERRIRIQNALDDAEKRCVGSNRALERKTLEFEDLNKEMLKMKSKYDSGMLEATQENDRLGQLIREKEKQSRESESKTRYLTDKAHEFEEMFNGQLDVVKALQASLFVAYEENKALVKEMEMLNTMFSEMERSHVEDALKGYETSEVDLSDTNHKDEEGKEVGVHDLLKAVNDDSASSKIQESCFKEVVTKNGTKMVLSVSKTFMKLKDLILEKKTLEGQLEKMKNINHNLSNKVNTHEVKLFNITDELNKTWDYVSTLKWQHKKLHTSEQILRAELLEKRQLLAKLREELEYSRQNWILVKQKTADSEREWRALRDEFAARRQLFQVTSSESGFSDNNQTEEEESPDPPSSPKLEGSPDPGVERTAPEAGISTLLEAPAQPEHPITVFVPPLDFTIGVPEDLVSPLPAVNPEDPPDGEDSMLADDDLSVSSDDELDEDVEPRTDADDEELVIESPDLLSEVSDVADEDDASSTTSDIDSDYSLEEPFPPGHELSRMPSSISDCSSNVNMSDGGVSGSSQNNSPVVWDQGEDEETDGGGTIPEPPPPPSFSLVPPSTSVRVNPVYANLDSQDDSSDEERDRVADLESSTNVTRLLIKHLPKQMAKLRHEKTELEEKIQDLEAQVSQQAQSMSEMERRSDNFKREAERAKAQNRNVSKNSRIIPIVVSQPATFIRWTCSETAPDCKLMVTGKSSWSEEGEHILVPEQMIELQDGHPTDVIINCWNYKVYLFKISGPVGLDLDLVKFDIKFD